MALNKNPRIGAVAYTTLRNSNIDIKHLFTANKSELTDSGLPAKLIKEIALVRETIDPGLTEEEVYKRGISCVVYGDSDYPELLKQIYDPPQVLYYIGKLPEKVCIGVVGSRKPTDYGRAVTKELSFCLAQSGICIVSGLALGIDSLAHEAALEAEGETVAVLGSGVDLIYPSSHQALAKRIINQGAIISEYPPGTTPQKQHFPARNRIISGISSGLLVTEAGEGSGSLITARSALEQNREVYAVPGAIYNKNSYGPNSLIKLGAKAVTEPKDILEELGLVTQPTCLATPRSADEAIIFEALEDGPSHIDQIIKDTGKTHAEISSLLTLMETGGRIKHLGGMEYRLNK